MEKSQPLRIIGSVKQLGRTTARISGALKGEGPRLNAHAAGKNKASVVAISRVRIGKSRDNSASFHEDREQDVVLHTPACANNARRARFGGPLLPPTVVEGDDDANRCSQNSIDKTVINRPLDVIAL